MCLCHQAVLFGTGQGTVIPCGWEGSRRSGVALALRHRLQCFFIHLRAHGLRKGDEPILLMEYDTPSILFSLFYVLPHSFCAVGGLSFTYFYRAMLCIRGTSHGPVSVRLSVRPSVRPYGPSVTSRCSTKTAKRRITQTTPHDSPGTLVS